MGHIDSSGREQCCGRRGVEEVRPGFRGASVVRVLQSRLLEEEITIRIVVPYDGRCLSRRYHLTSLSSKHDACQQNRNQR